MEDLSEKELEQKEYVDRLRYRMIDEGFHYCFDGYSHWEEIEDPKFHKFRKKYLKSAKKLKNYIENKMKGENDE